MKTARVLVDRVCNSLGNGGVVCHATTEENIIGQSGVHTFAGDVINIVLGAQNEADAYKQLIKWICDLDNSGNPNR